MTLFMAYEEKLRFKLSWSSSVTATNIESRLVVFSFFQVSSLLDLSGLISNINSFLGPRIPEGYVLRNFCGFVEELVLNDDPEYQWMDKIRTPRTSNEARQKLFIKLSGEVQRRIGLKVLELGANSVLGYLQNFDLEGEHGIVVRGTQHYF